MYSDNQEVGVPEDKHEVDVPEDKWELDVPGEKLEVETLEDISCLEWLKFVAVESSELSSRTSSGISLSNRIYKLSFPASSLVALPFHLKSDFTFGTLATFPLTLIYSKSSGVTALLIVECRISKISFFTSSQRSTNIGDSKSWTQKDFSVLVKFSGRPGMYCITINFFWKVTDFFLWERGSNHFVSFLLLRQGKTWLLLFGIHVG